MFPVEVCVEESMEFDLLYEGPLPSQSNWEDVAAKSQYKQCIRSAMHPQLRRLIEVNGFYDAPIQYRRKGAISGSRLKAIGPSAEEPPEKYKNAPPYLELGGHKYVPLFTAPMHVKCDVDITILSRGDATKRDTDNRVKLILDALRIPRVLEEVDGYTTPYDPCVCLFEDDGGDLIGRDTRVTRELLKEIPVNRDYVVVWVRVTASKAPSL